MPKDMGTALPADARQDLTQTQVECLRKIAASRSADPHQRYVLPDDVHDLLIEKGYIRWERGTLLITTTGILALARTQVP